MWWRRLLDDISLKYPRVPIESWRADVIQTTSILLNLNEIYIASVIDASVHSSSLDKKG
jgi:hypothetical protein